MSERYLNGVLRRAGVDVQNFDQDKLLTLTHGALVNIAYLIASDEREECADFVEDYFGEAEIAKAIIGRELLCQPDPLAKTVPPIDTLEYEIYRHRNKTRQD